MFDRFRQFLVYGITVMIIGTVWTLAWARQQTDLSELGFYPSAEPELFKKAMDEGTNDDAAQRNAACTQPVTALDRD